jgi:hypothetical protein
LRRHNGRSLLEKSLRWSKIVRRRTSGHLRAGRRAPESSFARQNQCLIWPVRNPHRRSSSIPSLAIQRTLLRFTSLIPAPSQTTTGRGHTFQQRKFNPTASSTQKEFSMGRRNTEHDRRGHTIRKCHSAGLLKAEVIGQKRFVERLFRFAASSLLSESPKVGSGVSVYKNRKLAAGGA